MCEIDFYSEAYRDAEMERLLLVELEARKKIQLECPHDKRIPACCLQCRKKF